MDKNFHMGYTMGDIIEDMNRVKTTPTGVVNAKPVVKVKTIIRKKPMFIRRTK